MAVATRVSPYHQIYEAVHSMPDMQVMHAAPELPTRIHFDIEDDQARVTARALFGLAPVEPMYDVEKLSALALQMEGMLPEVPWDEKRETAYYSQMQRADLEKTLEGHLRLPHYRVTEEVGKLSVKLKVDSMSDVLPPLPEGVLRTSMAISFFVVTHVVVYPDTRYLHRVNSRADSSVSDEITFFEHNEHMPTIRKSQERVNGRTMPGRIR